MGIILTVSLFLSAPSVAQPGVQVVDLSGEKNRFGFKLLAELITEPGAKNIFISPYSITTALTMTYNGAAGETKTTMAKTLGITAMTQEELNNKERALGTALQSGKDVELLIANSLWARKGVGFNSQFIKTNRDFYRAEVTTLDFNRPDAVVRINNWVKEKTRGKIERIVQQIKPEAVLFLINAVYFKGKWQEEFDPKATYEADFRVPGAEKRRVMMMRRSGKFHYFETPEFQAVELPYGDARVSMLVFLPQEEMDLVDFVKGLTPEKWQTWRAEFRSADGDLSLPRFKLEYEKGLKEVLQKFGMGVAFDLERADFSPMVKGGQRVAIGEVKHKTFVEVNEVGTEAAGVTSVEMVLASVPRERFSMVVDRPFFFAIQDNDTGVLLFLGAVTDL